MKEDGTLFVTLSNANLKESYKINTLIDASYGKADARILTGSMNDHNTFENPDAVADASYDGVALQGDRAEITLPPCSVVTVTFRK